MRKVEDLASRRYGKLIVLERVLRPAHFKNKGSYWRCRCDCGNETVVSGGHLRARGHGGCRECSMVERRKSKGECSFNGLYLRCRAGAKTRDISFELSKEVFRGLTKGECHYCGALPNMRSKVRTAFGEYVYNGVDRKSSDLGYTESNCVSCCNICNRAKNDSSYEDFQNWIEHLTTHRNNSNGR